MKPRRFVHQGTVQAAAFWVDEYALGTTLARRRILEMPGIEEVRRMERGLFVRLRAPAWVVCDQSPGVPLVVCQGILIGAPLDSDELEEIAAPSNAVVLVRGGETLVVTIESCAVEDLASWIDLSDWHAEQVKPLGIVRAIPRGAPPAKEIDPRKVAGIGPPPEEAEALVAALKKGRTPESIDNPRGGFASSLLTALSSFVSSIAERLGRSSRQTTTTTTSSRVLVAQPANHNPESDWTDRLRLALNSAAARLLIWARLASWVGRRQADYLEKTFSMFDSGNLEEALRHAIPLGTGSDKPKPLALGVPTPRADLSIKTTQSEASSTMGFGGGVYEALRIRYRKAVEQLEKQGKIKEAAFVLAELLGASEEAVSFLEKHGEYQLAAELAEGRQLDPALVVRQWILAGNRDRAVLIARRTGAFAAAVAKLEPSHPEQAAVLRILWANQLAAAGAYGAAVQAIWPVEKARHLARDWLDRGIAIGGVPGARLLATKAWLVPEEFASVAAIIRELPRNDTDESVHTWMALAQSVLANSSSKTMRILARACVRALMPHTTHATTKSVVERLTSVMDDPVFVADIRRQEPMTTPARHVRVQVGACADVGLGRNFNEDGYWVSMLGDGGSTPSGVIKDERALPSRGALFAVADGMGGYQATEVVHLVFDAMGNYLRTADRRPENIGKSLVQAVEEASVAIYKKSVQDRRFTGCGSTITAAWLFGDILWIAQVGDTRAYLYRDGILKVLTQDHSLINELILAGKLSAEEIESFEHKSVITRALGIVERVKVDLYRVPLLDGDRLLLCTDGVHGVVDFEQIADVLRRPHEARDRPEFAPKAACDLLKKKAYEAGAPDNMAMIVVDIRNRDGHPPHARAVVVEPIAMEDVTQPLFPEKRVLTRDAADTGTMHVRDAVVLPGGRLLVALGEAGVRMLSPEGKTLVHFDQPAERIVISDHGDRAIVLSLRGEVYRAARMDLVRRRAERWFDAKIDEFADSFDGSVWFVCNERGFFAIDALDESFASLWDLKESHCSMGTRSPDALSLFAGPEVWLLEQPSFRVRARRPLPLKEDTSWPNLKPATNGTLLAWVKNESTQSYAPAVREAQGTSFTYLGDGVPESLFPAVLIDPAGNYGAFGRFLEGHCVTEVYDLRHKSSRVEVDLHGAKTLRTRFQGENLIITDDCGRVLVVNVEQAKLVAEWRI